MTNQILCEYILFDGYKIDELKENLFILSLAFYCING